MKRLAIRWQSYSVGGLSPYFLATSVWAYAASHNEYKWAISISDLARLIALLNISIALSKLPLKTKPSGYFSHIKKQLRIWKMWSDGSPHLWTSMVPIVSYAKSHLLSISIALLMSSRPKSRSCFHWSCNKLDVCRTITHQVLIYTSETEFI